MSSPEDIKWFRSKFSWYTAALAGTFGVVSTFGAMRIRESSEATVALLKLLAPDRSQVEDVSSIFGWGILVTFILLGVVFAGSVFNIWCKLFMACRREKFATGDQDCCSNSVCCFSLLSVSRFTMNVVHGFCMLTILWFAVLVSVQTLLVFLFWHTKELAAGAQLLESTDQAAQTFTADTSTWLHAREEDLSDVIFNMSGYCSRVQCGTTIVSAMETLETIRKDTSDISTGLDSHDGALCPAVGCLKVDFIWFMKNSTCLCDQDGIATVREEANDGENSAYASLYLILASIFLLGLLLSKMSANLKSLVKDDHWMQRLELVLDRLQRGGIARQESIVDIMQNEASMSNFVWPQHNGPTAPRNQTFGLGGEYGGLGAKAAIAPPSSGAEDVIPAANTIDGPHRRPAEAHL